MISKILLYAIHNLVRVLVKRLHVVLSGFQRYICMQYTTIVEIGELGSLLFYQDFKDTFGCNTQRLHRLLQHPRRRFIRISKILLYAIHNTWVWTSKKVGVVLLGFQRYFCVQYTTSSSRSFHVARLFYHDFKDTFVCNTQRGIWRFTTWMCCFIRISKILLYAIHNAVLPAAKIGVVVLSGFQWTICCKGIKKSWNLQIYEKIFWYFRKKLLLRLFNSCKSSVNSKIDKIQRCYD